jgi:hypothetical protein
MDSHKSLPPVLNFFECRGGRHTNGKIALPAANAADIKINSDLQPSVCRCFRQYLNAPNALDAAEWRILSIQDLVVIRDGGLGGIKTRASLMPWDQHSDNLLIGHAVSGVQEA